MHSGRSAINQLPLDTLAAVLDQSMDCVKLLGLDGRLTYMNPNGQCAMEVDDAGSIIGRLWTSLWPREATAQINTAFAAANAGEVSRFDAYCPTVKGAPRWWNVTVSPIRATEGEVVGYVSISRDATEAVLGRQALETTTAEMRHRLKNSYAMVSGLMSAYARGTPDREEFAQEIVKRLIALGTAQTMFVDSDRAPCQIGALISALAAAFDVPGCPVVLEPLPDVTVNQGQADAIALVFGELAVNSTKHGALGFGGVIRINVAHTDGRLMIDWGERSERAVKAHDRTGGQGLYLMERVVRARRGTLTREWLANGLDVRIEFDLSH